MKPRLVTLLKGYLLFILLFVAQKPLFMLYHWEQASKFTFGDFISVIWHGLPMDLSTAGYFMIFPGLLLIASLWIDKKKLISIAHIYTIVALLVVTLIFIIDIELYSYWGFRIDTTPFFYLLTPKDAMASIPLWKVFVGIACFVICFAVVYFLFKKAYQQLFKTLSKTTETTLKTKVIFIFISSLLFIPIRGGVSVSTMNVGSAFFSNSSFLNHSAINPVFNLFSSIKSKKNFAEQYRFMDDTEAHCIMNGLLENVPDTDSVPVLLNTKRPNIVFFILESFMSKDIPALGGLPVAQNLNKLCNESVVFTHMYANSFRTDRGIISILSGYPAQPTNSIMQNPEMNQKLPSIQKTLIKEGYHTAYYYGGDADFTNMRSYLVSSGIEKIVSDKDFSLKDRLSKWGAPDHVLLQRVQTDLQHSPHQPFIYIVQTLSSHEPFEVPMHRFENPYLNSVAYTDSCLGVFIDKFRKSPLWGNTLLVFVPDHAMRYPDTIENTDPNRYKIPLILAGGAVKKPMRISHYGSQIDIAATLLRQMELSHSDFKFSKNMLNTESPEFGFFSFVDGFGFVNPKTTIVYDHTEKKVVVGNKNSIEFMKGKAFLQCLYDDLAKKNK